MAVKCNPWLASPFFSVQHSDGKSKGDKGEQKQKAHIASLIYSIIIDYIVFFFNLGNIWLYCYSLLSKLLNKCTLLKFYRLRVSGVGLLLPNFSEFSFIQSKYIQKIIIIIIPVIIFLYKFSIIISPNYCVLIFWMNLY